MQTLGDETGKIHFLELGNFFSGYYVEENKENELKSDVKALVQSATF